MMERIRKAILDSGKVPREIAEETGVSQSAIYRIVKHADAKLNMGSMQKLCKYLKLRMEVVDEEQPEGNRQMVAGEKTRPTERRGRESED